MEFTCRTCKKPTLAIFPTITGHHPKGVLYECVCEHCLFPASVYVEPFEIEPSAFLKSNSLNEVCMN